MLSANIITRFFDANLTTSVIGALASWPGLLKTLPSSGSLPSGRCCSLCCTEVFRHRKQIHSQDSNFQLSRLLSDELAGLLYTSLEERPVLHDELDVIDRQINDHTSDLRSTFGSNNLFNELVKDGTNLGAVVRVTVYDGRQDLAAAVVIALLDGYLLLLPLLLLLLHLLRIHGLLLFHQHFAAKVVSAHDCIT